MDRDSDDLIVTEYENGKRALVTLSGSRHSIEVSSALVTSGGTRMSGSHYSMSSDSSVKVEVQYFPYGEDRTLFSGTDVIHYYPAPSRDEQGRPVIEGEVVSETNAQELSVSTKTEKILRNFY